ncbi:hypothetical protein [Rhodococcus erythropolis]|uniref:hypothetical protein n=1 Tax=Rhodococcus erythropolis TaxID=1833 RepID=UPI0030134E37
MKAEQPTELSADSIERYNTESSESAIAVRSLDDISRISKIFINSGMFKGDKSISQAQQVYQAGVKIIAGVEFGIQPFAAMRGINIINGNAEMSANLMAAKVKKHPKYDYRVKQWDKQGCTLTFYEIPYPGAPREKWDELGDSSFDHDDAVTAQLASGNNWKKFARNMYFARAMSNGVRIYTPDVFYGAPVYVEGEISGEFDSKPETAEAAKPSVTEAPAQVSKADEAVEGEIVTPVEEAATGSKEPTKQQLHQISALAVDLDKDEAWVTNALMRVNTSQDADMLIERMEEELAKSETLNDEEAD